MYRSVETFLVLLCLFVRDGISDEYNETRSKRAIAFAGASYCGGTLGDGVNQWNCHACEQFPGVNATVFSDPGVFETDQIGFVAFDPEDGPDGSVIVAFAGTDPLNLQNYIDDIDIIYEDYPFCDNCKVHKGFYENWKAVEDQVVALLGEAHADHPAAPIRITGHSLGAAVAVHAALYLTNQLGYDLEPTYTFGQPRVGNSDFNAYILEILGAGGALWRVTHRRDPIPHLPTCCGYYSHPPTEVFYADESDGPHVVCDTENGEDPTCSDQYELDILLTDHMYYVGFDLVENYLYCKL